MKKIFRNILFVCFLFTVFIGSVGALSKHTDEFYINDFANVLSDDTKNYVFSNSKLIEEKTGAQIVVVTVGSLDGDSIENYSLNLFREWQIGQKDKNNGLLILLAPNERKVRIEVGYGLEGAINDAKAGRLRDEYGLPHFKNDDWNNGIKNLYMSILAEVYKEYNMDIPEDIPNEIVNNSKVSDGTIDTIIWVCIIGGIVIYFINYKRLLKNNNNRRPPFIGGPYQGDSTFFGGSNFGGGSFGGGGGSSGGGGASGSF